MAPLNLCFYILFYVFLLSLFTRLTSALFIYDKRTLLDIGHRCTNLLLDTTSTNTLTLPLSSRGTSTKPTSGRSCRTSISMYPVQLEDRIHWIIATLFKNAYKARSLPAFGKSDHAAIFLTPEYKQRIVQESPGVREVTRWSSHSEAMLQASLDDVDWDMFRASSADVSEFTDVALSFVYMLTDQATETVTIRTFSNQKPWVDRTIRAAVNQRTAAYNAGLLSGNMSDYKASCYALRRAVRAAKLRYRERIESHFQLNDSRRMWQGLKTICSSGNNPSAEVSADPLLAEELNTFYGRFKCNGSATLPISASGSSRQSSDVDHVITVSSGHQESPRTWWDYRPRSEIMRRSACWFVYFHL